MSPKPTGFASFRRCQLAGGEVWAGLWDSVWVLGALVWGGSIGVWACFGACFFGGVWGSGAVGMEYEMWLIIGLDKIWIGV